MEREDTARGGPVIEPKDACIDRTAGTLTALSKEIEHALVDLQGPLDALELVTETMDLRHGTAVGWLVRTASDSAGRLREQWEQLHELARKPSHHLSGTHDAPTAQD